MDRRHCFAGPRRNLEQGPDVARLSAVACCMIAICASGGASVLALPIPAFRLNTLDDGDNTFVSELLFVI